MIREFGWIDVLYLVLAMRWTLALTVTAFVGGGLIGLVIAVLRVSRVWPLQAIAVLYVQAIQGTPLLVLLFVFFFGLSIVGLPVLPWIAAALAFSIYAGAFLGEIWRGALDAIPDSLVDELIVWGSPEQCRDHIGRYVANGVTTPAIAVLPFGVDQRQAIRDLAPVG